MSRYLLKFSACFLFSAIALQTIAADSFAAPLGGMPMRRLRLFVSQIWGEVSEGARIELIVQGLTNWKDGRAQGVRQPANLGLFTGYLNSERLYCQQCKAYFELKDETVYMTVGKQMEPDDRLVQRIRIPIGTLLSSNEVHLNDQLQFSASFVPEMTSPLQKSLASGRPQKYCSCRIKAAALALEDEDSSSSHLLIIHFHFWNFHRRLWVEAGL